MSDQQTPAPPAKPASDFFSKMATLAPRADVLENDPEEQHAPAIETPVPHAAPEPDEDELPVNGPLELPAAGPAVAATAEGTAGTSPAAETSGHPAPETTPSSTPAPAEGSSHTETSSEAEGAEHGQRQLTPEQIQELQQRQEQANRARSGGGGGSVGLFAGLAGMLGGGVAALASGSVNAADKGFKTIGNGLKALGPQVAADAPAPMSRAERKANASASAAVKAQFYADAGPEVFANKIYRDIYNTSKTHMDAAAVAAEEYGASVGEFNDTVIQAAASTQLQDMADAHGSSIGDYVHGVTSGTIKNAAAEAIVKTLDQAPSVKASQQKMIDAADRFSTHAAGAIKGLDAADTGFPGKMDTETRKAVLNDLASDMKSKAPLEINDESKKMMEKMEEIIKAIKESIMRIVKKVASAFTNAA